MSERQTPPTGRRAQASKVPSSAETLSTGKRGPLPIEVAWPTHAPARHPPGLVPRRRLHIAWVSRSREPCPPAATHHPCSGAETAPIGALGPGLLGRPFQGLVRVALPTGVGEASDRDCAAPPQLRHTKGGGLSVQHRRTGPKRFRFGPRPDRCALRERAWRLFKRFDGQTFSLAASLRSLLLRMNVLAAHLMQMMWHPDSRGRNLDAPAGRIRWQDGDGGFRGYRRWRSRWPQQLAAAAT
jgi:hypothetical protein